MNNPTLIDTDILSYFLRGHPKVVSNFENYFESYGKINFSLITYYEILSGLEHRDAQKQVNTFLEFAKCNTILPLTEKSVTISAKIYGKLRKKGTPVDDVDLLIAGVAMANELVLITHNQKHFGKIEGLTLEDWSESP